MNTMMRQIGMGLMFSLFTVCLAGNVDAQILKGVKDATTKVTKPMKDVQSSTKSVTKPIQTTRKDIQTITRAPKDIKQEAERTKGEFDKAGNDIQKAGDDVKRTKESMASKKNKDDSDSTATTTTTTTTSSEPVVIDERRDRSEVGANKTTPAATNNETISPKSTSMTARPRPVPKPKDTAPASAGTRSVPVTPENSTLENAPRVKPDYSNSPARYALQRADFDTETLQDLFDNAVWDGPGRAHTMRSISFHLRQLKSDIDEVRKIDQSAKVTHYDRQYKEWYAEYTRREREGQAEN